MSKIVGEPIGIAHDLPMARRFTMVVPDAPPDSRSLVGQGFQPINRSLVV